MSSELTQPEKDAGRVSIDLVEDGFKIDEMFDLVVPVPAIIAVSPVQAPQL